MGREAWLMPPAVGEGEEKEELACPARVRFCAGGVLGKGVRSCHGGGSGPAQQQDPVPVA